MAMTGISTPAFWLGLGVIVLFYGQLQILPGGGRLDDWLDPPAHVTGFYLLDALLEGNGEVFFNALQHLILPSLTLGLCASGYCGASGTFRDAGATERGLYSYRPRERVAGVVHRAALRLTQRHDPLHYRARAGAGRSAVRGSPYRNRVCLGREWEPRVVTSIQALDFPAVMGFAVVVSLAYVFVNLVVDLLYLWIDPRIGRGGAE